LRLPDYVRAILRCPTCHGALGGNGSGMNCATCQRQFPLINGVLRFVDAQHYASSFGFQWLKHDRTQLDSNDSRRSEQDFAKKTGLTPDQLAGKLVLDVGCGMGRFAEVVSRWGAHVVGIDLSQAVEAAARNLADRDVTILQADVFSLPFAAESFDYIYSMGVLHHTPDCEKAFKVLPPLLKTAGGITIWLYSAYNKWYRMSDVYRKFTRRLPHRTLHSLCYLTRPLYAAHQVMSAVPVVGKPASGVLRYLVPMSFDADPHWRQLDTFDWYSPWYQSKHTYEEVFRWFESCGLQDLHVGGKPICVRGSKPPAGESVPRVRADNKTVETSCRHAS
jgi:2-polyprenyl-3-methyl-5-hydroxy-6-metoxy-1,4-benzoquinol methylase